MLMPKRVKFRKSQRGRMAGKAKRGSNVAFGDFGLKALEPHWITSRQIEACRVALSRINLFLKNLLKPGWVKVKVLLNSGLL